ncbi:hypothetical protein [Cerasicoccus maritimus]|uniref:hypothetical protein n=1 Tax=Cerasicoccus maritimus TaxID=490089 RepID=UPI0028526F4C|nr:hypothetical protein [Cerasicoccus maritimus]
MQQIYQILPEYLDARILNTAIYPKLELESFWTNDWSPGFFARLAQAGFLTISCPLRMGPTILVAQLHPTYSVLSWPDLHIDRKVARLVRRGELAAQGVHLRITANPHRVCFGIRRAYGNQAWLTPRFAQMMAELATGRYADCRGVAVELWRDGDAQPIGGEIGYLCGAVYTSLTGYLDRSAPNVHNLGKVQLAALGIVLERCGYRFWNLGQSIQQYKKDLGAKVTPRMEFLPRWLPATRQRPALDLSALLGQRLSCQTLLAEKTA